MLAAPSDAESVVKHFETAESVCPVYGTSVQSYKDPMTAPALAELPLAQPDGVIWVVAVGLAAGVLVGLERYRSRYRKGDLLTALGSLLALALVLLYALDVGIGAVLGDGFLLTVAVVLLLVAVSAVLSRKLRALRESMRELNRTLAIQSAPIADGGDGVASISVVVPARDAEETVGRVVDRIPDEVHGRSVQPIVVSDGSTDRTTRRAAINGSRVLEHPVTLGRGSALATGFEAASRAGASVVVTMDADGSHPPDRLPDVVRPVLDGEADFVVGSGFDGGSNLTVAGRAWRRAVAALVTVLTKSDVRDPLSGYCALRVPELARMDLSSMRHGAPELVVEARKNRLRTVEVRADREWRPGRPSLRTAISRAWATVYTWLR